MTFKSYLESNGENCPKCGSSAIKASAPPEKVKGGQGSCFHVLRNLWCQMARHLYSQQG